MNNNSSLLWTMLKMDVLALFVLVLNSWFFYLCSLQNILLAFPTITRAWLVKFRGNYQPLWLCPTSSPLKKVFNKLIFDFTGAHRGESLSSGFFFERLDFKLLMYLNLKTIELLKLFMLYYILILMIGHFEDKYKRF